MEKLLTPHPNYQKPIRGFSNMHSEIIEKAVTMQTHGLTIEVIR